MGWISLRRCVVYIRDPDMMVTFDLKVKFIGILTCLCFWPVTSFCFDIAILSSWDYVLLIFMNRIRRFHIWHMSVSPWDDVSHTFMTYLTLTFGLNITILLKFSPWFCVWGKIVFALWHRHTKFGTWVTMRQHVVYIHDLCMTMTFDLYRYVGDGKTKVRLLVIELIDIY